MPAEKIRRVAGNAKKGAEVWVVQGATFVGGEQRLFRGEYSWPRDSEMALKRINKVSTGRGRRRVSPLPGTAARVIIAYLLPAVSPDWVLIAVETGGPTLLGFSAAASPSRRVWGYGVLSIYFCVSL